MDVAPILLMITVTAFGRFVKINDTENDSDYVMLDYGPSDGYDASDTAPIITDDYMDAPQQDPTPAPATYTPEAATSNSGEPLKITMWAAVNSKVLSSKEREEMFYQGGKKPPLALQKMLVVAHVDHSKHSPKTLKLYEVNAQIDPDFGRRKEK